MRSCFRCLHTRLTRTEFFPAVYVLDSHMASGFRGPLTGIFCIEVRRSTGSSCERDQIVATFT